MVRNACPDCGLGRKVAHTSVLVIGACLSPVWLDQKEAYFYPEVPTQLLDLPTQLGTRSEPLCHVSPTECNFIDSIYYYRPMIPITWLNV